MATQSKLSQTIHTVAFYIRSLTVPAFVLIVTAAVVAAMPLSLSSEGQRYVNEPRIHLSDSWAGDEANVTFDHMFADR